MPITHASPELTSNPEDKDPFHKKQQLAIAPNTGSDDDEDAYYNQDHISREEVIRIAARDLLAEEIWEKKKRELTLWHTFIESSR